MPLSTTGGALEFDAIIKDSQFESTIRRIESQLQGLTATATKEAGAIDNLIKKTTQAIAGYATFSAGTTFISDIVKIRGEFQQLEVAFTTMLGSKEKSDKLLAEVTEFAATTPFELKDVAAATKQLLAFGISADQIKGTLRSLGDVSAGIGAPLGEIAYLFGTIKTQGVALTQDVRQFAQRGIPIYDELAKILGVTTDKVGDFITAGKVGFPQIEQVFKNLTKEGSKFGGLMEAQSQTLTGLQSNLRDAIDQMFNDLGKSGEGIFADAIKGATVLVKNYEKVIDVIKVIAITYGAYRAALIATNIVEQVSIARKVQLYTTGKALSAAQALQTAGTLTLTRVTKLLNLTMLANPYIALTVAVAGFVSAIVFLSDRTSAQEKAQRQLNDANEKYKEDVDILQNKTTELVSIINSETTTRFAQVQAFQQLKALYPELLKNMDLIGFKTLSAEDAQKRFNAAIEDSNLKRLTEDSKNAQAEVQRLGELLREAYNVNTQGNPVGAVNELLDVAKAKASLLAEEVAKVEQALWEANTPPEEQIKHFEKIQDSLVKQRAEVEKNLQKLKDMGLAAFDFRVTLESTNLAGLNTQLDDVNNKLNALRGNGANPVKDKSFFTKQKSDAQAVIDALDVNDKNFSKTKAEQTVKIREAEHELAKYDTTVKRTSGSTAAHNKLEHELNALLEKRKSLIKEINDQVKLTEDFGKSDNQKELDAINTKYDELIKNVTEYNNKVKEFNKKNPKSTAQQIGLDEILNIANARQRELNNASQKQQAELFKQSLDEQQQLYTRFEESKKEVGLEKARELYGAQADAAEKYYNQLKLLQLALAPKFQLGIESDADRIRMEAIAAQIKSIDDKRSQDNIDRQSKEFTELLSASATYNQQKAAINKKYDDLEATLRKNSTIKEGDERKRLLDNARQEELDALNNSMIRQSALYKKLNQDIISFTRERIKDEIKILEKKLKIDGKLTPQQKADIQSTIDQYKGLLDQTNQVAKDFGKLAGDLVSVSSTFGTLATSVGALNKEVGDSIQLMSDMASVAADAASSIASFATGDVIGGVSSAVSAISKIIDGFAQAAQSKKDAKQDILDFQAQIIAGESQYNQLIRERERQEIKLHKTKLKGLQDEKRLLDEQKNQILASYNEIFAKLQSESFISGLGSKKKRGSPLGGLVGFFSGTRTETTQQLASLAGKSFEDIEKLFTSGQLTDKAKELFEQLQRLKEEGLDIDSILAQNAENFKQALTGTTADSIIQSITDGFAQGKRSASDFADTFKDLMQQALLQSLQMKYLEGPLTDFFDQFASLADSDGQLSSSEISTLQNLYNSIIDNAATQFDQLQQVAGLNLSSSSSSNNSLTGAIKGITEQQAELLAGQFGGLRITSLEILAVSRQQLSALNMIQVNTGTQVLKMMALLTKFDSYETGTSSLKVRF